MDNKTNRSKHVEPTAREFIKEIKEEKTTNKGYSKISKSKKNLNKSEKSDIKDLVKFEDLALTRKA